MTRTISILAGALWLSACGDTSLPADPNQPPLTTTTQSCSAAGVAASDASALPTVCLLTSQGELVVELDDAGGLGATTVANFLTYVEEGFYAGTVFHRSTFPPTPKLIQGGGYRVDARYYLYPKPATHPAIPLESDNGLSNLAGTIGMARTSTPGSATSQFYVNVTDNLAFDHDPAVTTPNGYAVFGRVISGMDAVVRINDLPVFQERPYPVVVIYWAKRLK